MSNKPKSLLDFHQAGWNVIVKYGKMSAKETQQHNSGF